MKDISKNKISITGMNCRLTNMANRHTRTAGRVHLIKASILLLHRQFVQLGRDMISGTRIGVSLSVNILTSGSSILACFSSPW
jgi:hypothetical protein